MPRVHLFYRHDGGEVASRFRGAAHALDSRNRHALQVAPEQGGAVQRLDHVGVGDGQPGGASPENRVVAVSDAFDPEHGLRIGCLVMTRVLAIRAFVLRFLRVTVAFQDDLRAGRHGQIDDFAPGHLHRLAPDPAHVVVLAFIDRERRAGTGEHDRIHAQGDGHRHALVSLGVLRELQLDVFPRNHPDARRFLVMHHHAVGADVHTAGLRIPGDDAAGRPDVSAPVAFVPLGNREFENVDFLAPIDVFLAGAVLDPYGGNLGLRPFHPGLGGLDQRGFLGQAQCQGERPFG